jgi:peptide chain release factor
VTCQQTRSLSENRHIARKILRDKVCTCLNASNETNKADTISQLDKLHNPGLSKQEMQRAKQVERERRRRKKAKKRAKEREERKDNRED